MQDRSKTGRGAAKRQKGATPAQPTKKKPPRRHGPYPSVTHPPGGHLQFFDDTFALNIVYLSAAQVSKLQELLAQGALGEAETELDELD